MLPNITNATVKLVFQLDEVYRASFCTDIEAPGLIQYHHLLVIYEPGKQPVLCIGAEWGRLDPGSEEEPVLGYFDTEGHTNCGNSNRWCDEALFILQAIKIARNLLRIDNQSLVDGEMWAFSKMMTMVQSAGGDCVYADEYRMALAESRGHHAGH